jgi:hypothetical protein
MTSTPQSNLIFNFMATDFSSYYIDFNGNKPNSLIPNNNNISIYNGIYNNIYLYDYTGNISTIVNVNLSLSINNSKSYIYINGIKKYLNYQEWIIPYLSVNLNNQIFTFENVTFNPVFLSDNDSQYNLINKYKGFSFPKSPLTWYSTTCSNYDIYKYSFQMIWGQGDIPSQYYNLCGLIGDPTETGIIESINPFTNTNGPYYFFINNNNNYAYNSGWIIVIATLYNYNLINPPYLEDI